VETTRLPVPRQFRQKTLFCRLSTQVLERNQQSLSVKSFIFDNRAHPLGKLQPPA